MIIEEKEFYNVDELPLSTELRKVVDDSIQYSIFMLAHDRYNNRRYNLNNLTPQDLEFITFAACEITTDYCVKYLGNEQSHYIPEFIGRIKAESNIQAHYMPYLIVTEHGQEWHISYNPANYSSKNLHMDNFENYSRLNCVIVAKTYRNLIQNLQKIESNFYRPGMVLTVESPTFIYNNGQESIKYVELPEFERIKL